jgi:hypothetical protein
MVRYPESLCSEHLRNIPSLKRVTAPNLLYCVKRPCNVLSLMLLSIGFIFLESATPTHASQTNSDIAGDKATHSTAPSYPPFRSTDGVWG